jgi:hypothetical protein
VDAAAVALRWRAPALCSANRCAEVTRTSHSEQWKEDGAAEEDEAAEGAGVRGGMANALDAKHTAISARRSNESTAWGAAARWGDGMVGSGAGGVHSTRRASGRCVRQRGNRNQATGTGRQRWDCWRRHGRET